MDKPKHVYEVYIRTTPEKLWEAITRPEMTRQYFYGNTVETDWKVGSSIRHTKDGKVNAQADAIISESTADRICVELLLRTMKIVDEIYPKYMHALWS